MTENSTIIALLEEPLGNDQDPQPTVTRKCLHSASTSEIKKKKLNFILVLIRGPFGRHAWTMQLRHLPRSKSGTKYHAPNPNPGRPVPMNDMPQRQEVEQRFFPDGVDRVPPCVADYSIPTLDQVIQKIGNDSTKKLFQLLESQTIFEKLAWAETESSDSLSHAQESVPPPVCHEFQAARLFLSHFGLLSIDESDANKSNNTVEPPPLLTVLDATKPGFPADLLALDKLSPRTNDTLHVFYLKPGQSTAQEIVDNMSDDIINTLDQNFWTILLSLGDAVYVDDHAGWTGFVNNSWKIKSAASNASKGYKTGSDRKFNGEKRILYWADVSAEIAFVVPTKWNKIEDSSDGSCLSIASSSSTDSEKSHINPGNYERSVSVMPQTGPNKTPIGQKPRTLSLELDKSKNQSPISSGSDPVPPSRRRTTASKPALLGQSGAKIFLVWLECFEDHLTLPIGNLICFLQKRNENFN